MQKFRNFREFVDGFDRYSTSNAITIRRFIALERLTYGGLRNQVYQAANYLLAQKIVAGDRVMLVAPNSPDWVIIFLATQVLGVTAVTVDVSASVETVTKFANITSPKLVFRSATTHKELVGPYNTVLLEDIREATSGYSTSLPRQQVTGEEGTIIVFTSGTTADPKGVVLSQRNILSNLEATQQIFNVLPSWRFLSVLPLSHMYELTVGCLLPLFAGASIFYVPQVTPLAISRALFDYQITVIAAVPQLSTIMLDKIEWTAAQHGKVKKLNIAYAISSYLPHVLRRRVFAEVHQQLGGALDILALGGAPIDPEVARKWELMGVKVVQGYGLTETSPILAANVIPVRRLDSQGRMLPNINWKISSTGELLVNGPSVFKGYYNNPQATADAFDSEGYFKTGDIGKVDADNWLHIFGRAKFAIVLPSGLKVFPEDVEQVAKKNKSIKGICVIRGKTSKGETVKAVIVSEATDKAMELAISTINQQLESHQHIDSWTRWPDKDFPRNRLLKVDRRKVQDWADNHQAGSESAQKVVTNDPLLQIMAKVLGKSVDAVAETEKLADIGLDSLGRLTVVSIIEEQLGIVVAEAAINQHTTLAALRKLVAAAPAATPLETPPTWPFKKTIRFLGNICRDYILGPLTGIWIKYKIIGQSNLQGVRGPLLVVFNHVDYFDAAVIYGSLPKNIRQKTAVAAGDDVLKDFPALGGFTRFIFAGYNFARKEPILPSLKYTADLIDKGWSVALSPEGRISKNGKLQEFKSGIGLLAVELGVPVVCITTSGLFGTMSWGHFVPQKHKNIVVHISEPLTFSKKTSYEQATKEIRQVMLSQTK